MEHTCIICKKTCNSKCSICKETYYCGIEHQKQDWSRHKIFCNKKLKLYSYASPELPDTLLLRPKSGEEKLPYKLTTEEAMHEQTVANKFTLAVAFPLILASQPKIEKIHSNGKRCFISIELIRENPPTKFEEFPYVATKDSPIIYDLNEAEPFAKKVQSSKLLIYTQTYKTNTEIPIICFF